MAPNQVNNYNNNNNNSWRRCFRRISRNPIEKYFKHGSEGGERQAKNNYFSSSQRPTIFQSGHGGSQDRYYCIVSNHKSSPLKGTAFVQTNIICVILLNTCYEREKEMKGQKEKERELVEGCTNSFPSRNNTEAEDKKVIPRCEQDDFTRIPSARLGGRL